MTHRPKPSVLLALLWKYRAIFWRYKGAIAWGVVCLLLVNGLGIMIPWQIKEAVDAIQAVFTESDARPLADRWQAFYQSLGWIALLATAVFLSRVASRQLLLGTGRRVEADIRNRLYAHLLKMPAPYFSAHPTGELMSRLTNDVDATKYLTGGGIMLGANTLFAYVAVIPMMLILNWPLALATFLFYPVVIKMMTGIAKKVREGYGEVQEVLADISTVAQENLNGMGVIQSYVREETENRRFEAICDRYFFTYTRLIHERILLFMVLAAVSGLSTLTILSVGGWQVIAGRLDLAGFVAFTMYLEQLAWPTMALGWTISIFQQGTAALERIDEVFDTPTGPSPEAHTAVLPDPVRGALSIRHLTFAYHNPYADTPTPPAPVLQEVSLDVSPGETVVIVGPVGSGKSTLLRLLTRLDAVPAGHIFLDGVDITQLSLNDLRRHVILMPQLSFLFSTTVTRNIGFGAPDAHAEPERLIVPAAETAAVHADIMALPRQYQTLVGERGLMLSGGQRQRVALARSLMMDATVLLLDDPFSNVDADTERRILEALQARHALRHKTTLIATHRFSLVALADRVVLMQAGRILAAGTHAELLATQPLYRELNRLQALREQLKDWQEANP